MGVSTVECRGSVPWGVIRALHGERLAAARLSVGEDGAVVAVTGHICAVASEVEVLNSKKLLDGIERM